MANCPRVTSGLMVGDTVSIPGVCGGAPTVGGTVLCTTDTSEKSLPCECPDSKGCSLGPICLTLMYATSYLYIVSTGVVAVSMLEGCVVALQLPLRGLLR